MSAFTDGLKAEQAGSSGGSQDGSPSEAVRKLIADGLRPGGSFLLDAPKEVEWIWGKGQLGFWARGEAMILCSPNGVGKTTIGGQLADFRSGLSTGSLLGFPVTPGRRVLYLAMDRPTQTRRSISRLYSKEDRIELDEHFVFWPGPPVRDFARHPDLLAVYAEEAKADTVFVDSLKDAALKLAEEETGGGWNRARQICIAEGSELAELHHPVKDRSFPPKIEDVFGSAWIVGGAGSVLFLDGQPGDLIVRGYHLKPNAEVVDPFEISHDPATGRSVLRSGVSLIALGQQPGGVTAASGAAMIHAPDDPTKAQREKVRRHLEKLVSQSVMTKEEGSNGGAKSGSKGSTGATYFTVPSAGS